jgi:hypothetical protein
MHYVQERKNFLTALSEQRLLYYQLDHFEYPDVDLSDYPMFKLVTDVALLLPRGSQVEQCVVVVSGTHGLEGAAGSRVQTQLLQTQGFLASLVNDTALLLIHDLNPWGYYCGRRVTHENIDLNRNAGLEFRTRCDYSKLADLLFPKVWDRDAEMRFTEMLDQPENGKIVQAAATGGQYDFPTGIFYGGQQPCFSILMLQETCKRYLSGMKRVAWLDVHTGLGEWGKGDILSTFPNLQHPDAQRIRRWFGYDVQFPNAVNTIVSPLTGDILNAVHRWLPGIEVTSVGIEMGTGVPVQESLPLLVAENWAYHHPGEMKDHDLHELRRKIQWVFDRDDPMWQGALFNRCRNVLATMIAGLRAS